MKATFECIPCLVQQSLEAVKAATDDESIREQAVRAVLAAMAEADLSLSPPRIAQQAHRIIRTLTKNPDPYLKDKERFNCMALTLFPALQERVATASDPFDMAVRLAVAGNVIDLGVPGGVDDEDVHRILDRALAVPMAGRVDALRQAARRAGSILYLADNAGEIVFDRLLLQQLPLERVTVAVRGEPILNDATMEDARFTGLADMVRVMDNGSDAPGTVLEECSDGFCERFAQTDLIIAKGQGNYETLCHENAPIFFLFKVKCPVVAELSSLPLGSHACLPAQDFAVASGRRELDALDALAADMQAEADARVRALLGEDALDRWQGARFAGVMTDPDGLGELTGSCGDTMRIYLRMEGEQVAQASYFTDGCGSSQLCGSCAAELAHGRGPDELGVVTGDDILELLGHNPNVEDHCAHLAARTLQEAVGNWLRRRIQENAG